MLRHLRILLALTVILQVARASLAQHADILIDVVDGQLTVNETLFLSDFRGGGPSSGDVLELRNPGYLTQGANVLQPGELLSFDMVGPLLFSDGTTWRPAETNTYFRLFRPPIDNHSVVVTGQTTNQTGFPLAQADDRGMLHEHIRFQLGSHEEGPPTTGVYGVRKVLTSPPYISSEPFMLIFNHGLDTPRFIQSVVAARQLVADTPFDCTGDGLLMANDLVCVSSIEQRDRVLRSIGSVAGDLDGDGGVKFSDFLVLSRNFGSEATSYAAGNIDLVGGVAFPDFLILSRNFGFTGAARSVTVPEPSPFANAIVLYILVCRFLFLSQRPAAIRISTENRGTPTCPD